MIQGIPLLFKVTSPVSRLPLWDIILTIMKANYSLSRNTNYILIEGISWMMFAFDCLVDFILVFSRDGYCGEDGGKCK